MADKEYMTELDKSGMRLALKKKVKKQFVIFGEQTIAGKTTSLESLQDLIKRDKERKEDGFPSKIKFRKVLAAPDKVINVPYVDEEHLIHGQFEPKNIVSLKDQAASSFDMPDIDETTGHGDD